MADLLPYLLGVVPGMAANSDRFKNLLMGKEGQFNRYETLLPEQKQALLQLLGQSAGPRASAFERLQGLLSGDPAATRAFEAPYMRQFQEETLPELTNRFAGMGSHGNFQSSAFQNALAGAGTRLSENLAALRGQLAQQASAQLPAYLGLGQQQAFGTSYQQPQKGLFQGLFEGAGAGLGKGLAAAAFA